MKARVLVLAAAMAAAACFNFDSRYEAYCADHHEHPDCGGVDGGGGQGGGAGGGGAGGGGAGGGGAGDGGVGDGGVGDGGVGDGGTAEAPCVPETVGDADGIFVVVGGDDTNQGSVDFPKATVEAAMEAAAGSTKPRVFLAEGTYSGPVAPSMSGPVSVEGAWEQNGATWQKDCRAGRRSRTRIAAACPAMALSNLSAAVTLKDLTVTTMLPADAGAGASCLAVTVSGGRLELDNVSVSAAPGNPGLTPPQPSPASALCLFAAQCGDGTAGGMGAPPAVPGVWSFNSTGFVPATGRNGSAGSDGAHGTLPTGTIPSNSNCWDNNRGCTGVCPTSCGSPYKSGLSGGAGVCGCGGRGGQAGWGGVGGGASVALFASGTQVVLSWSELRTGNGGSGFPGSPGGWGGSGTPGDGGAPTTCLNADTGMCTSSSSTMPCNCVLSGASLLTIPGGPPGGRGGNGGPGSSGSPGGGGPAIALVVVAGSIDAGVGVVLLPGGGGAGSSSAGLTADAGVSLPILVQ
ncbi:MAG: hypothetical protein IT380_11390 [Myxococcales bacterium]|nr:hypothetical protein [Myxococcales bacterium]